MSAEDIHDTYFNCLLFLWDREDWDRHHSWKGPKGYAIACDEAIADIRAFELRGHMFEPPYTDQERANTSGLGYYHGGNPCAEISV